jgi:mono/diheme cytochrome c family protein
LDSTSFGHNTNYNMRQLAKKMTSLKRLPYFSFFIIHFSLAIIGCQNIKRDQYIAEGYKLFQANCANCHQKNGEGMANLYPPISKEYLTNKANVVCWIKYGINQPVVVKGKNYNRAMPGNQALQNLDIAEIMTYLYNTYDKESELFPIDSVAAIRERCK